LCSSIPRNTLSEPITKFTNEDYHEKFAAEFHKVYDDAETANINTLAEDIALEGNFFDKNK
jgi:hypothetical protein